MKRYLLYYMLGSLRFYQRLSFSTPEEAKAFLETIPHTCWKIFDLYKGDFVECSE